MSANVPEASIRRYYAEFANDYSDAHVAAVLGEVLTDDFVFHPPNNVEGYAGAERHRQWLVWHHRALANQRYDIEDLVATDERGAARWTLTGMHTEEHLGIPATGQTVTVSGQDFFRLRGGRIAELWRSFDWRAVAQQVGQGAAQVG
jgi:steroid delta-isomerase-like uncharacterized protein